MATISVANSCQYLRYWAISNRSSDNIHRFFDSSPFSPSGRYVAHSEFPSSPNNINGHNSINLEVVIRVYDLKYNISSFVDKSSVWGSQVGSHAQWGASDEYLIYNSLSKEHEFSSIKATGIVYNIFNSQRRILSCPVYHISVDGRWGVSPNLSQIHHTQKGYGIDSESTRNILKLDLNPVTSLLDGIYVTDLQTGRCKQLVSLQLLVETAGLSMNSPTFGFHTKWSTDGTLILCVIRTLEHSVNGNRNDWSFGHLWNGIFKSKARVRVQHLFVIPANFSSSECSKSDRTNCHNRIRYLLSWASQPFSFQEGKSDSTLKVVRLLDGNHPNWVPGTHIVSMNLQSKSTALENSNSGRKQWSVVVFDADSEIDCKHVRCNRFLSCNRPNIMHLSEWFNNFKFNITFEHFLPQLLSKVRGKIASDSSCGTTAVEVFPLGTGHPNFFPGGRYLLLDAYAKEAEEVSQAARLSANLSSFSLLPDKLPLKLIDVLLQKEVWLLQAAKLLIVYLT